MAVKLVSISSSAFEKLFFIRYTDLGEDRPIKPVPNFWHLQVRHGNRSLFRFSLLPSPISALSSLMAEGIRFLNWERARAIRCGTDHLVRHLRGLHCNEETKWRERGDRLRRLVALLTPVTSTTIVVVAVAQRSAVEYIYQWGQFRA